MHVIKSNRATMGALGFSVLRFWLFFRSVFRFLCQKNFSFSVLLFIAGLRIFRCLAFGFRFSRKILTGFRIWYPMRFSVFPIWPIWVPGFSSIWAAITRLHWSWIATKCKCKRDKPIEISQGSLGSLRVAVPSSPPQGGGEGRARIHVGCGYTKGRLSTEHCQSFFINSTSKLVTKLHATRARDWLIQHSNRISKFSGLSSQMEMLD